MTCVRRALSTVIHSTSFLRPPQIIVSTSTLPYLNLATEDWLLKNAEPDQPTLFLYRNAPSVIIGRNQNPWKEVNHAARRARGIWLARRHSGGGTVYHDAGNSNYSIHLPRAAFDRARTGRVVERAVRDLLGVPTARMNARNDLVVVDGDGDGRELKVSGSAYKIAGRRAYHHGTMLLASALDELGAVLHNDKPGLVTKGVESVRAPVTKLHLWTANATHENFVRAMVQSFNEEFGLDAEPELVEPSAHPQINEIMAELESWDWIYGQTPEFTHTMAHDFAWGAVTVRVHSKHAIILDASVEGVDLPPLEGRRYGTLGFRASLLDERQRDVVSWLENDM